MDPLWINFIHNGLNDLYTVL